MKLSKPRWNPAVTTIAFVVGIAAAAAVLSWATRAGPNTNARLVDSAPFRTWVALASFAVVAFVDTLVAGLRELRRDQLQASTPKPRTYGGLFLVFAAVVVATLRVGAHSGPAVGVQYWPEVNLGLLVLGVAAAGPWVVAVWASHGILSHHRAVIPGLSADDVAGAGTSALDDMMGRLLDIRQVIAAAVGRLLVLVLAAVLLSGALHAALVPDFTSEDDFPSFAVLIYGAFFTVILALAVLPLMLAWRQTATLLLDQAHPIHVTSTADDAAARERMAQRLNVNGSLFTSPVALSSVLAPLVTSLLAVFIPQIGGADPSATSGEAESAESQHHDDDDDDQPEHAPNLAPLGPGRHSGRSAPSARSPSRCRPGPRRQPVVDQLLPADEEVVVESGVPPAGGRPRPGGPTVTPR